jgi:hypothetical protein
MVPVGAEISKPAAACTWPFGATCAGCIVDSDGAHPPVSPRAATSSARGRFTPDYGITPSKLSM